MCGAVHIIERDLIRERTMAGLAAAQRRGRVGGRPTVMTAARSKQATRMVTAGTPLTEIAEVLRVSRTTLYRHLKAQPSTGSTPSPDAGPAAAPPPVVATAARSQRACPSCGHEPTTREEAAELRADLAVRWLHPDPKNPGSVVEGQHCRACHPRSRVVDVECARCGDGPIVTGALAEDSTPGSVAYPARRWLVAAGWSTAPELVCPAH